VYKTSRALQQSLVIIAAAALVGCADDALVAPDRQADMPAQDATVLALNTEQKLAILRRVTARYHNLNVALADGFVLLHPCEVRPGEGAVGAVYVHFGRVMDGLNDLETPDALIYDESGDERPRLVGVEFAIPYALWTKKEPPTFLGRTFQPEDEFGVFALHAWVWRANPNGMFAEAHPGIACAEE
jgi:hypothetical protein